MTTVILATTSPYKKKVFSYLGIPFRCEDSRVDEKQLPRNNPRTLVKNLAILKAKAVAQRNRSGIIIGLDSVGFFRGKILEKPRSLKEAQTRLRMLSTKTHYAYTGVCAINAKTGATATKIVSTKVTLRKLSPSEISEYVKKDKSILSICLGYDPESGLSSTFVKTITGSYHNLLNGMPIEVIPELLKRVA